MRELCTYLSAFDLMANQYGKSRHKTQANRLVHRLVPYALCACNLINKKELWTKFGYFNEEKKRKFGRIRLEALIRHNLYWYSHFSAIHRTRYPYKKQTKHLVNVGKDQKILVRNDDSDLLSTSATLSKYAKFNLRACNSCVELVLIIRNDLKFS